MPELIEEDKPLPKFRPDLRLFKGPDDSDGSPTYNIYDPTRGQYFRITWGEGVVLRNVKPGMTLRTLLETLKFRTTVKYTAEDIKNFYLQAAHMNLLLLPQPADRFIEEAQKRQTSIFRWLLMNYLYIRVPLLNPDRFLEKTLPLVKPFYSTPALILYVILTLFGLGGLVRNWDEYIHTFTYFFNLEGIIIYVLAVSTVKIIHEFSHAYTAKHFGIHVPTMGVVLIVMWPALYTDVTDAWKLKDRYQRFAISFAGVGAEFVLAGLSTFAWTITAPGLLKSIFFISSSVTLISSVMVNLNPAMRWDGYYILCDLWAIDNLQPRAFAITRWKLHQVLLGIDVPPPELFSPRRVAALVVYSLFTWIYRLVLYTSIAVFVYYQFTKSLGIILFFMEIVIFILWPIKWEVQDLMKLKEHLSLNMRSVATLSVLALALLWFSLPLSHTKTFPAITIPAGEQVLYVPISSRVEAILVHRGSQVKKDQVLVRLSSQPLKEEIADLQADVEIINTQIELDILLEGDPDYNPSFLPQKLDELAGKEAKLKAKQQLQKLLTVKADTDGTVYSWDEDLKVGQFVKPDQILGKIVQPDGVRVLVYLPEEYLDYAQGGEAVWFRLKNSTAYLKGSIEKIEPSRVSTLQYHAMASTYKGDVPVVRTGIEPAEALEFTIPQPKVLGTYYPVTVVLDKGHPPLQLENTGYVQMKGPRESWLSYSLSYLTRILWRESNF